MATEICLTNGMSIETLSKILGHKSIKTTQIYGKITRKKNSRDMDFLENSLKKVKELSVFWDWCTRWGWNPATDEPSRMTADFLESAGSIPIDEDEPAACDDPEYLFVYDATGSSFEIFDDNYN